MKVEKSTTTPSLPNKSCKIPTQPPIQAEIITLFFGKQRKFGLTYPGETEVTALASHLPVVFHGSEHDVIPAHAPIHFR